MTEPTTKKIKMDPEEVEVILPATGEFKAITQKYVPVDVELVQSRNGDPKEYPLQSQQGGKYTVAFLRLYTNNNHFRGPTFEIFRIIHGLPEPYKYSYDVWKVFFPRDWIVVYKEQYGSYDILSNVPIYDEYSETNYYSVHLGCASEFLERKLIPSIYQFMVNTSCIPFPYYYDHEFRAINLFRKYLLMMPSELYPNAGNHIVGPERWFKVVLPKDVSFAVGEDRLSIVWSGKVLFSIFIKNDEPSEPKLHVSFSIGSLPEYFESLKTQ